MQSADSSLRFVVLSEDTSKDARATIEALVRKMLPLVEPNCRPYEHIGFVTTEPADHEGMHRDIWKGTDSRHYAARVRLQRYIARRLSQPNTFVLFHVDGDTLWENRAESDNKQKFDDFVIRVVQSADAGQRNVQRSRRQTRTEPAKTPEPDPQRLIPIIPFYTLEAWLYQNLQQAITICRRKHNGAHVDALREWEAQRAQLDEIVKPADHVCLNKEHNLELAAQGFPARVVYDLNKSFHDTVERLKNCGALCDALARAVSTNELS